MLSSRTSAWFYIWSILIMLAGCWAFLQWNHPLADRARTNLEGIVHQPVNWNALSDWYARYIDSSPVIVPVYNETAQLSAAERQVSGTAVEFVSPAQGSVLLPFQEDRQGMIFTTDASAVGAVADGRIIYVGAMPGLGQVVIIQHAAGYQSWYGILSKLDVEKNDWVNAGQPIGAGVSTPTGSSKAVFLGVKDGEAFLNPLDVIRID